MHAREGHPSDPIAIHRSLIVLHGWVHDAVRGAERPATHGIHDVTVAVRLFPRQFTHEAETSGELILHPQLTRFWSTTQIRHRERAWSTPSPAMERRIRTRAVDVACYGYSTRQLETEMVLSQEHQMDD